jgi:hypothetical protein
VLPTAPTLEKRAKPAAVPKLGVCAKFSFGRAKKEMTATIEIGNLHFMVLDLRILSIRNVAGQ